MSIIHKLSTGQEGQTEKQETGGVGVGLGDGHPSCAYVTAVEGRMQDPRSACAAPGLQVVSGTGGRTGRGAHHLYSQTYPLQVGKTWETRENPHTPDGLPTTPAWVQHMLEEAGATLLALPNTGHSTRLRQGGLEWVRDTPRLLVPAASGSSPAPARPPAPHPAAIDRMDRVLAWLSLIPDDKFVLRRVAGARALVHPLTGRYLFPWRRLGVALGADHKAVQRWHTQAMQAISAALNQK